jgi:RND family efflux transporter MFP subunit
VTDPLSRDLASLRIERDSPKTSGGSGSRKLIVGVLTLAVLGVGAYVGVQSVKERVFKPEITTTEVALLSPAQAEITVTSSGYIIPQVTSKVGAKVPGRIKSVSVKEGDVIKAGDLIAVLDDEDQKSLIATANARVAAARARILTAKANTAEIAQQATRQKALVESGAVSRATFEDLDARRAALAEVVRSAEAEAQAAQAEVEALRVGLKDRTIVAPIGGTIIGKPLTVGETVGTSFSQTGVAPIAEIVDMESLLVETDVPESRLYMAKLGAPAEIVLDAYPTRRYRGEVVELGKRINRAKATALVKVKFKDTLDGVLPEMSARVSLLQKEIDASALKEAPKRVVSPEAITERGGAKVMFVVEGGKLRATPVRLGGPVGPSVELLDGPPPGTKVVVRPAPMLADGQRVKEEGS